MGKHDPFSSLWAHRYICLDTSFDAHFSQAEEALLDSEQAQATDASRDNVTIPQVFALKEYRKSLAIVCSAMLAQQVSGALRKFVYVWNNTHSFFPGVNAG